MSKDKEFEKRIAKIESVSLGFEDHGILTTWLFCDYGGSCQGVGGLVMSTVNEPKEPAVAIPGFGNYIVGVLRACGVSKWEDLPGRTVFMLFDKDAGMHDQPLGIEPLPTEEGERFLFNDWRKTLKL